MQNRLQGCILNPDALMSCTYIKTDPTRLGLANPRTTKPHIDMLKFIRVVHRKPTGRSSNQTVAEVGPAWNTKPTIGDNLKYHNVHLVKLYTLTYHLIPYHTKLNTTCKNDIHPFLNHSTEK
ncbi:hypothetical protein LSH36_196g06029 [Paralvinella palmiformis]|uniref:Uncharacterized protein n=1 Tax=Paralvinella palmiformis TaxID=53620 RepID=A0AAD9N7Q7_9ANNE|nr:hypothetical protein LSH36_196g06029 [Paralvinella palmiformis]